jgi:hypothetical protein
MSLSYYCMIWSFLIVLLELVKVSNLNIKVCAWWVCNSLQRTTSLDYVSVLLMPHRIIPFCAYYHMIMVQPCHCIVYPRYLSTYKAFVSHNHHSLFNTIISISIVGSCLWRHITICLMHYIGHFLLIILLGKLSERFSNQLSASFVSYLLHFLQ